MIVAVVFGGLALNSWAQVIGAGATNAAPPGVTNTIPVTPGNEPGGANLTNPQEVVWIQDATPEGASVSAPPQDAWDWTNAFWDGSGMVGPYSGSLMHVSPLSEGWHQHFFSEPGLNLVVNPGELLFSYIYLPWTNAPATVMLMWLAGDTNGPGPGSWDHRVFWGEQNVSTNGTATNAFYAGALPPAGRWVRLSVPAGAVGLEGQLVQGMSFAVENGAAAWDRAGKVAASSLNGSGILGGAGMTGAGPLNQSVSCVNPPVGLVGWWQGQTNCSDFMELDPGVSQGSLAYTNGEVGCGFSLDGTDADVRIPASATLNVGTGPGFTVEGWINPSGLASRPIVEWNNPNNNPPYGVQFWSSVATPYGSGPGCLYANLVDTSGGNHYFTTPGNLLTNGVWQHVALTFNASSGLACIYLNGSLEWSVSFAAFTPQTAWDLYLGARPAPAGGVVRWYGGLDEMSLYDRALGAAEIGSIYNAGSAGKCTTPPACDPPPAGLVSWWPAEGTCADRMGVNNGTPQGGLAYTSGMVNDAFYLNGSADVMVGASSSLNVGTGSFTVETWINPSGLASRPIVEWNSGGGSVPYGVHLWSSVAAPYGNGAGCLYANLVDTSAGNHYLTTAAGLLTVGAWQHVALVYDHTAGQAYIYFNGGHGGSNSLGVFNAQTSFPLYFGARVAGGAAYWLGEIDEVGVYTQALAQAQIQGIYNAGHAGKCAGGPPAFSGLINLDFGGATSSPKTGLAAVGESAFDFWNYLGPQVPGPIANLKDADGTVSPVSVTMANLNSAGTDGCTSDPMYNAYVFGPQGQSGTLTLNSLPAGSYTVFAYSYDGSFSLSAGGTGYGTVTTEYNIPPVNPAPWVPWLHYAFWDSVALSPGQSLVLTVQPGPHNGYAAICGLQIAGLDPDGSGLPVCWETEYFGQRGLDPNGDPTGDGLSNWQKYLWGANPELAVGFTIWVGSPANACGIP
jgi:hypothetical protein